MSKVLGNVKKKSPYNQPKPYFFQKIIVKSFLDRFLPILHQNIRNCLYFDCLFTHYVVMSERTLFYNLQSRARTHAILAIGLYELLANPTTLLIEPPR